MPNSVTNNKIRFWKALFTNTAINIINSSHLLSDVITSIVFQIIKLAINPKDFVDSYALWLVYKEYPLGQFKKTIFHIIYAYNSPLSSSSSDKYGQICSILK
jgi:hypothetical protein